MSLTLKQKFLCWRIEQSSQATRLWIWLLSLAVVILWLAIIITSFLAFSQFQAAIVEIDRAADQAQQQFKHEVRALLAGTGFDH